MDSAQTIPSLQPAFVLACGLLSLGALSSLGACTTDSGDLGSVPQVTEIAVDPSDFLGDVACSRAAGALRSYVVTLSVYDDADDLTPFVLASSAPTPCSLRTGFRDVVADGKLYTAEIDAYDVPPSALVPFGGASSGSRQMHAADGEQVVTPRWTTGCGHSVDTAARAVGHSRVFVRDCDPLVDSGASATAISLLPAELLGPDPCAVAASVDVEELLVGLPPLLGLACDADAVLLDAIAGQRYLFYARTADGQTPIRGTECYAVSRSGLTVVPTCAPLSASGAIRLRLDDLVVPATSDPVCPAGFFYDLLMDGLAINALPLPCEQPTHLGPLDPGTYLLEGAVFDAQGGAYGSGASCGADVQPGRTTEAFCLP